MVLIFRDSSLNGLESTQSWRITLVKNSKSAFAFRTSGSERCHQAQDALGRPVVEKTAPSRLAERQLGSRHPLRVLPLTPTHRRLRLEWCRILGNWTAAESNQVVFSDESRFNFSSDNNRVRVWRPVVNTSILPLLYSDTPLPQLI
ncbi:transposable element Tcb1 transposase [Trichonephila clavipes]|nr:transposable element Tcb1 transposase [Trichonephila clavipes]